MPAITLDIQFHPKQEQVYRSLKHANRICLLAGRRFGKSFLAESIALKYILTNNMRVAYVAPKYEYATRLYDNLRQRLTEWNLLNKNGRTTELALKTKINSYIRVYSADGNKDVCRGDSWDLVIIDEAARIRDLQYIVNQSVLPTLTEKKGKLMIISTPMAISGEFFKTYQAYKLEMENGNKEYFAVKGISEDNTFIEKAEWAKIRSSMSEQAQAVELDAIPSAESGLVFGDVSKQLIETPTTNEVIAYGLDLGQSIDYTVLTGINGQKEIIEVNRFKAGDWNLIEAKIMFLILNKDTPVFADASGVGAPVTDFLRLQGYNVHDIVWTGVNKTQMVSQLQKDIRGLKFVKGICEDLITELAQYEYNISDSGKIGFSAPLGLHDDCVASLINLNYGIHEGIMEPGVRSEDDFFVGEKDTLGYTRTHVLV